MELVPTFVWLVTSLLLLLASVPIAAAIVPRLADRGASVALPLGLFVVGLVTYWVGQRTFGVLALVVPLLVLGGLAGIGIRRGALDRVERRPVVEALVVFTIAFLFMVAVRALDPAVHPGGGEKFLDYGLFRRLLRSATLPPEDFWFAGEPMRYYYVGHMLSAWLARLTGTPPRLAYNLALSGFYGMLVTAAYGLAGNVAAARGGGRVSAGVLGAFFVGFAANLLTAGQVVVWVLPDRFERPIAEAVAARSEMGVDAVLSGLDGFSYWTASRVIPGTINEFPLFAWLNGDLHAHMMTMPFLLLVATLGFAYYRTPAEERGRRLLLLAVFGPLVGFVAATSTWSLPTALGLTFLALAFAPADPLSLVPRGLSPLRFVAAGERSTTVAAEVRWLGGALVLTLLVAGMGALTVLPFLATATSGRSVAFLPDRSGLFGLLTVHGVFLLVFLPALARRLRVWHGDRALAVLLALALGGLSLSVVLEAAAVGLFVPLALAAWWVLRRERDFATLLVLAGAGLVVIVEFVYVVEGVGTTDGSRFNTVFKYYSHTWVIWGPAAGALLARFLPSGEPAAASLPLGRARRASVVPTVPVTAGQAFVAVVVLVASLYGVFALSGHVAAYESGYCTAPEEPTLDALAFVEDCHPEEAAAIYWLAEREDGVVAARPTWDTYRWGSPSSSLTGLPTVAGWSHETLYRGYEVFDARATEADAIFVGNASTQVAMLRKHDVRWVYVGPQEREQYGNVSFEWVQGVEPVDARENGRFGGVTLYAVDQSELGVAPGYDESVHEASRRSANEELGREVSRAVQERYCSQPEAERPAWVEGLCESG